MSRRISPVIPGFGLTLGYTVVYLSLIVLIPLGAMFVHAAQLTWEQFWAIVTAPRVLAALKLSFGTALIAAIIQFLLVAIVVYFALVVPINFVKNRAAARKAAGHPAVAADTQDNVVAPAFGQRHR